MLLEKLFNKSLNNTSSHRCVNVWYSDTASGLYASFTLPSALSASCSKLFCACALLEGVAAWLRSCVKSEIALVTGSRTISISFTLEFIARMRSGTWNKKLNLLYDSIRWKKRSGHSCVVRKALPPPLEDPGSMLRSFTTFSPLPIFVEHAQLFGLSWKVGLTSTWTALIGFVCREKCCNDGQLPHFDSF